MPPCLNLTRLSRHSPISATVTKRVAWQLRRLSQRCGQVPVSYKTQLYFKHQLVLIARLYPDIGFSDSEVVAGKVLVVGIEDADDGGDVEGALVDQLVVVVVVGDRHRHLVGWRRKGRGGPILIAAPDRPEASRCDESLNAGTYGYQRAKPFMFINPRPTGVFL